MHLAYIALGSNQGDRRALLDQAIRLIEERTGSVEAVSTFIETKPQGFVSMNSFLNAALRLRTPLQAHHLLDALQAIERELGRQHKSQGLRHSDRPIDLDILLYDQLRIQDYRLSIPHLRLFERDFVLIPLRQVLGTSAH